MAHITGPSLFLALLTLAACGDTPTPEPAPADETPATADLGPPKGEPIQAVLTAPPHVPPPIDRDHPAKVIVELEVIEEVQEIADGVQYTMWTFGGTVPGSFIRVRQGDTIEFHLQNHPDNKMPHNIDLHAVTGPGGGAEATFVAPGQEAVFDFKALNPGLYVYHCATAPVGMHIANGMYGLILVEPPEGLPPVDREFYVMQGDFYTEGDYREPGLQPFSMDKAIDEDATYVLFNGRDGALTGEGALEAEQGERIRIFMGNGGPNLVSSFHVIGEIFDRAYREGGTTWDENIQTSLVPAGGSGIFELTVDVPGTYVLVDHSIFRAFNKGALGTLVVSGEEVPTVFDEHHPITEYKGAARKPEPTPEEAAKAAPADQGASLFAANCAVCHQPNGEGLPGVFPPLAGSDYLMEDEERAIGVVLNGLNGPITVNGSGYDSAMPPMSNLSDQQVADILTYVRTSWGNEGDPTTADEVAAVRGKGGQ